MTNKRSHNKHINVKSKHEEKAEYIQESFFHRHLNVLFFLSLILNLFLAFSFVSGVLLRKEHNTEDSQLMESSPIDDYITYMNPVLEFRSDTQLQVNFAPLKRDIGNVIDKHEDLVISVYFESLNTGANFNLNGDLRFKPASMVKVPLAIAVVEKVENGELSYTQKIEITDAMKEDGGGELYKSPKGTTYTVEKLLEEMLKNSDNTAKNTLFALVTPDDMDSLVDNLGLESLFDNEGLITSKEYARVLRALYSSTLLDKEDSLKLLRYLMLSNRNRYLGSTLPKDTEIAHKFGIISKDKAYNDGGIIYYPDRPYILIVLVDGGNSKNFTEQSAAEIIGQISKMTYSYMSANE